MYDDENMTYNTKRHRYVLTPEFVSTELNINLEEAISTSGFVGDVANEVEHQLDRVSRIIYTWIYSACAFHYETEKALAMDNEARTPLMEAMGEQLEYMLNDGDLSLYSGVNLETMQVMDKKAIDKAKVSSEAIQILINAGIIKFGYYIGEHDIVPTYDEDGY